MDLYDHIHRHLDGHHRIRIEPLNLYGIQRNFRKCTGTRYVRRERKQIPVILYCIRFHHDAGRVRGLFQGTIVDVAKTCCAGIYLRYIDPVCLGLCRILRTQKQHQDEAYEQDRTCCGNLRRLFPRADCRRHQLPLSYDCSGTADRFLLRHVFRLLERLQDQCRKTGIQGL